MANEEISRLESRCARSVVVPAMASTTLIRSSWAACAGGHNGGDHPHDLLGLYSDSRTPRACSSVRRNCL